MTREKDQHTEKDGRRGWVWLLFVFVVVQVILANSLVARGKEIRELATKRDGLRADIVLLENEIARASSLAAVQQGAEALGLKPGTIEFLPPPPLAAVLQ
jgi:hypothetical protein